MQKFGEIYVVRGYEMVLIHFFLSKKKIITNPFLQKKKLFYYNFLVIKGNPSQ